MLLRQLLAELEDTQGAGKLVVSGHSTLHPSLVIVQVDLAPLRLVVQDETSSYDDRFAIAFCLLAGIAAKAPRHCPPPWAVKTRREYLILLLDLHEEANPLAMYMTDALAYYVQTEEHAQHPHIVILDKGWNSTTRHRMVIAARRDSGLQAILPSGPPWPWSTATIADCHMHTLTFHVMPYVLPHPSATTTAASSSTRESTTDLAHRLSDGLEDTPDESRTVVFLQLADDTPATVESLWELLTALLLHPRTPHSNSSARQVATYIQLPDSVSAAPGQVQLLNVDALDHALRHWATEAAIRSPRRRPSAYHDIIMGFILSADVSTGGLAVLPPPDASASIFSVVEHLGKLLAATLAAAELPSTTTTSTGAAESREHDMPFTSTAGTIALARVYAEWRWGAHGVAALRSSRGGARRPALPVETIVDMPTFNNWVSGAATVVPSDIGYTDFYVCAKYARERYRQKLSLVQRRIKKPSDARRLTAPDELAFYRESFLALVARTVQELPRDELRRRDYYSPYAKNTAPTPSPDDTGRSQIFSLSPSPSTSISTSMGAARH